MVARLKPVVNAESPSPERPREEDGWRAGRPVEDPAKLKPWGFVTAKPSEFLVHVRRGQVLARTSGQGASCFKWPWDAVSVVPTSLQRLQFRADQVTHEKVGVEVTGLAVYRIAEPLLAFRLLNFSYPERAQEKLEETLSSMFVGAARRLVANLSVDECLQKRKSALGQELLREIAPVVGGRGAPGDSTDRGWGVVIDTIEIQEVRVLSGKVFSAMQAPFRTLLDQRALEATAQAQVRRSELEGIEIEAELAAKARLEKLRSDDRLRALEEARRQAAAELEVHEVRQRAAQAQAQLTRERAALDWEVRRGEAELTRLEGLGRAEVELQAAHTREVLAGADARRLTAENLPELAAAIGQKISEVKIVQMSGAEANPFASITQAVAAVLELSHRSPR